MHCDKCSAKTTKPHKVPAEKRTPLTYELVIRYYCDLCIKALQ